jgi:hypothetical protein
MTFDHPPINTITATTVAELPELVAATIEAQQRSEVWSRRVVVVRRRRHAADRADDRVAAKGSGDRCPSASCPRETIGPGAVGVVVRSIIQPHGVEPATPLTLGDPRRRQSRARDAHRDATLDQSAPAAIGGASAGHWCGTRRLPTAGHRRTPALEEFPQASVVRGVDQEGLCSRLVPRPATVITTTTARPYATAAHPHSSFALRVPGTLTHAVFRD